MNDYCRNHSNRSIFFQRADMNDVMKTATGFQFYTELINKFFNPQSYFYYCVTKYLKTPSSISNNPDLSIVQILSQFVDSLNKSKNPAQNLNEITQIKGFENIYANLLNQLIRYDLRSLSQLQLKKTIQKIVLSFLKEIFQLLLTKDKSRNTLSMYLDIKAKLTDILNGSNGKSAHHDLAESQNHTHEKIAIEKKIEESNPLADSLENSIPELSQQNAAKDSINLLENFFEKEIARLLKPLTINLDKTSAFYTDDDLIEQIHKNFSQINDLALYHGSEALEIISERIVKLLSPILAMKQSLNPPIIELIYDSKSAIEKSVFQHQDLENLNELVSNLDHYILTLEKTAAAEKHSQEQQKSLSEPEKQKPIGFELNTSVNQIQSSYPDSRQNKLTSSIFANSHAETDNNKSIDELLLPDDDDEELLKLIQENNSIHESLPSTELYESEIPIDTTSSLGSEDNKLPAKDQVNDSHFDLFANEIFQQEAVLYYKILLNAISQLKNEEKVQSALEDIELASSSLKQLAQKFSMEKFALVPELIESISIIANKHVIKLPSSILLEIENGVNLLKNFDVTNEDHKTSFMSILTLLKEYYSETASRINKNQKQVGSKN